MQPSDCRNCHGFPTLHKAEGHPQAASLQKKSAPVPGRVLCNLRAIELDRLVSGLSLTAGGVLGVLIAGWLS